MSVNEKECAQAGIDPKAVRRIDRKISKALSDASVLGLTIFGGSTGITIRFNDNHPHDCDLILADCKGGNVSGGDGGCWEHEDGLIRGE